jgi:dTMP kinase
VRTRPSFFVAFEGIDNTGKSTLVEDIRREFSTKIPVYTTKEFTSDIGCLLLSRLANRNIDFYEKVLLFAADRQQRLVQNFAAHLEKRCLCVADRWYFSALAYRYAENPSAIDYVRDVNRIFPRPDLTILVDISAKESIHRGRPLNKNNYEEDLLEEVRDAYKRLAQEEGFITVDGMRPYVDEKKFVIDTLYTELKSKGMLE